MKGAGLTGKRCPCSVPGLRGCLLARWVPPQLSEKRICSTQPAARSNGRKLPRALQGRHHPTLRDWMGMSRVRAGCNCGRNGVMERHNPSLSTWCVPCTTLEGGEIQVMHPAGLGTLSGTLLHWVSSVPISASHVFSASRVTAASPRYLCISSVRGVSFHLSFAELCFLLRCLYCRMRPC